MNSMNFEPKNLIVYEPEAMNRTQRVGGLATFLLFWVTFMYLFRPVFVALGWFVFGYIFNATISMEGSFLSETLRPIHIFMLIILVTMIVLPFWIAFKESYTAKRLNRIKMNIDKIIIPDAFGATEQVSKLPVEIIPTTLKASKITCYFDHKSKIMGLNLDGYQVTIENGKAKPVTVIPAASGQ